MGGLSFEGFGGLRLVADAFGSPDHPPVLLLPAVGTTRETWHGAASALSGAGRYAICLDPRGHGDSDHAPDGRYDLAAYAADLVAVLGQLSARATVVGVGGSGLAAALAVGEGTPGLVSALVLVGVTAWVDPETATGIRERMALRAADFADPLDAIAAIAATHPIEPEPTGTEGLLSAFARGDDGLYHWRCDPRILAGIDLPLLSARIEAAMDRIAVPVALVRGTANSSVSAEATLRLQSHVAASEVIEIEGSGHHVATDREDAFNAALLDFLERKAPRLPITYREGSEPRLLRDALGCFGTGVTIVTTLGADGDPIGLTANSFTSVSLDPPLILFCLARSSANVERFRAAGRFAINVLHIGQQPLSNRFARRDGSRFEGLDWTLHQEGGSPILPGSLASFDCRTHAVHEGGDHLIFVGEVQHAYFEPHRDPLLFFHGKYRRIHIG